MSRMSTAPSQRNLTLTEELEKLEQSITLTLQEIDHNFSRAHRIVTSSILPVVEQYADHSKNVWEGTKFWKQFFEASANVSLNGYEETATDAGDGTVVTESTEHEMSAASYTSSSPPPGQAESSTPATTQRHKDFGALESPSDFGSPDFSTPKPQRNVDLSTANYASPYEKLRREVQGAKNIEEDTPLSTLPSTPRAQTYGDEIADSSPFAPPSTARNTKTPAQDVLLHRVLDKNYRIQATPHAQPQLPKPTTNTRHAKTPTTIRNGYTTALDFDSSPMEEAPQLHIDDFRSPTKERRVPGVSVLTPAKPSARKTGKMPEATQVMQTTSWDSDSDEDGFPEGMSPPKTMQFHIPQSKLLKTPAQEASKRIVEDLLATAGPDTTEEFDGDDSPSVVKRGGLLEEDTF